MPSLIRRPAKMTCGCSQSFLPYVSGSRGRRRCNGRRPDLGRNGRKFHLVPAACNTSRVSIPMRPNINASSFINAMFRSRCVFSMTLAASATLMELALCTPAVMMDAYRSPTLANVKLVVAGHHFDDPRNGVLLIAGVDALGRITDMKILLPSHARLALQYGDANLFGRAWIYRGLVDDDRALLHMLADVVEALIKGEKSGMCADVHRCRDRNDDEIGATQIRRDRWWRSIPWRREDLRPRSPRWDRKTGGNFRFWRRISQNRWCQISCQIPPRAAVPRIPIRQRRRLHSSSCYL